MATSASTVNAATVIGPDTHIRGEMAFDSSARILGRFEGGITSKGEVHIGESAVCRASVDATTIVVDGTVEGDLTAKQCVQLNSQARVSGDILAATLVVAEGASYVGHCRVGPDAAKAPAPTRLETQHAAQPATAEPARTRAATANASGLTVSAELQATLAGLESKLANLSTRPRAVAAHAE